MHSSKPHNRLSNITEAIGNTPLVRLNKIGAGLTDQSDTGDAGGRTNLESKRTLEEIQSK